MCLCVLSVIYRGELYDLLLLCVFDVVVWSVCVLVMVSGVCVRLSDFLRVVCAA